MARLVLASGFVAAAVALLPDSAYHASESGALFAKKVMQKDPIWAKWYKEQLCDGMTAGMTDGTLRQACCPNSCGSCDDIGCETRGDGPTFCCPSKILVGSRSCKHSMNNRLHSLPPCVIEENDGYVKDDKGYERKAMFSQRGIFLGWHYKEPEQHAPKEQTADEKEAVNKNEFGYWDTSDNMFRHHGDTTAWNKKIAAKYTDDEYTQAHTGRQVRLTPLNDKRPICTRLPCKEGEIFVAHHNDGLPRFYKTHTPYGDMYMTTGPRDHKGRLSMPSWDKYGRYQPPKNVEYSVDGTTNCCESTCHDPGVIKAAKLGDAQFKFLSDDLMMKSCGYGCAMWLRHSSLNWEDKKWKPALRDRCIRDCEQPRKYTKFVHYNFAGHKKNWEHNQTKTETSPWLSHPLANANDLTQEAMCKKGCGFYFQCFGTPAPTAPQKTHTNPELEARLKRWGLTGSPLMDGQDMHGFGDESYGGFGRGSQKW
jgi:hypothetical protein